MDVIIHLTVFDKSSLKVNYNCRFDVWEGAVIFAFISTVDHLWKTRKIKGTAKDLKVKLL